MEAFRISDAKHIRYTIHTHMFITIPQFPANFNYWKQSFRILKGFSKKQGQELSDIAKLFKFLSYQLSMFIK